MNTDIRMVSCWRLWLGLFFLLPATGVLAQSPPRQTPADARMQKAEAAFMALPEMERKAIQQDLIWVGGFSGTASGGFGPLTFRAINMLKARLGTGDDGILRAPDRQQLASRAGAARAAAGFRQVDDPKTGVRIGIPAAILPKHGSAPLGGSRWQSADESITLDTRLGLAGDQLSAMFEKATAPGASGRQVTYKLLRPDFFVIAGETAGGKFYTRFEARGDALRGFSIAYAKPLAARIAPLVVAIANSFEAFPGAAAAIARETPSPSQQPAPSRPAVRGGVGLRLGESRLLVATAAISNCTDIRAAGKPAAIVFRDESTGLAVLKGVTGPSVPPPAARQSAATEGEALVLLSLDTSGAVVVLPATFATSAGHPAVMAPLQPGGAGSPAYDRAGRLVGIVTDEPSARFTVAGIVPQRRYTLATMETIVGTKGIEAGDLAQAADHADGTTGSIAAGARASLVAITCAP